MNMKKFMSLFLTIIADHLYYIIRRDGHELEIKIQCHYYMEEEADAELIKFLKYVGIETERDYYYGEYHFTLDSDGIPVEVEMTITNSYS